MQKIIYLNEKKFSETLENFKQQGLEKVHILVDFDKTLTKLFVNWKKRHSLIHSLEAKWYLWEKFSKKYKKYFEEYYPFEISLDLSLEEKKQKMDEWWRKVNKLLIENKLNKNDLQKIINEEQIEFRDWVKEFFKFLHKNNIPLVIISANGLGSEAIKMYLEKNKVFYDNIYIISNEFIWDKNGYFIDYKEPVIHVFNKDETVLKEFPDIFEKIKNRKNVILLWDSLWDPHMIEGFNYENLIKIWFLNDKVDELLEEYKKRYDIVITWDWDFGVVNEIVGEI